MGFSGEGSGKWLSFKLGNFIDLCVCGFVRRPEPAFSQELKKEPNIQNRDGVESLAWHYKTRMSHSVPLSKSLS